MDLIEYKQIHNKYLGKKELLEENKKNIGRELKKHKKDFNNIEKAQVFIQEIAKQTQENLRIHIEDIVQMALNACGFDRYKFKLNFVIKRGRTEADLIFLENGIELDPMQSNGGAVLDVASFAIRIAAWSLGKTDNLIIFDEPFKNQNKEMRRRAGEIMKKLSEKLNLQMVIVTHDEEIIDVADKIFKVRLRKNGKWKKSEIE